VSGEPDPPGAPGDQRVLVARLRAVAEAKDAELAALRAEVAVLRADLEAGRELARRLELRIAELERRLRQDSSDSGMPTSKEPIGAKERRQAVRRERAVSERERRKDRKPTPALVRAGPARLAGQWRPRCGLPVRSQRRPPWRQRSPC